MLIPFGTWCLVFILLVLGVLSVWYLMLGAHTAGARGQESEIAHCNRVVDGSLFMILLLFHLLVLLFLLLLLLLPPALNHLPLPPTPPTPTLLLQVLKLLLDID